MKFDAGVIVHAKSIVIVDHVFVCRLKSAYFTSPSHTTSHDVVAQLYDLSFLSVVLYQRSQSEAGDGAVADFITASIWMFPLQSSELLFIVLILVPLTSVSCFLYTCASVATAVHVFVAAAVLLGTTGLVPNVFVPLIVWFPDNFTTSLSFALFAIVVAYQSYVVTFPDVIPELRASSCACVNGVSLIVY